MNSSLSTPPGKRGLGMTYLYGDIWYGKTENTLLMIQKNEFDSNNQSCHNKLQEAITDICFDKKDLTKAIKLVSLIHSNNTKNVTLTKTIRIRDANFDNLHRFLVSENENKKAALKETIKNTNTEYITNYNNKLNEIKQSIYDQIEQLKKIHKDYVATRNNHIIKSTEAMKQIKNALLQIHENNPKQLTFKTKNREIEDPYCSDGETSVTEIEKTYSNDCIITKIQATYTLTYIDQSTDTKIKQLNQNQLSINNIQLLKLPI